MTSLLLSAFIYLASAAVAVPLSKRLGLGSVLGYLIAGVLIGPVFGLVGQEPESIQHVAEFGVVMMLFLVGLDVIGDSLTEINVTSPTGFMEITAQTGFDVPDFFIAQLEKRVAADRSAAGA